MSVSSVSAAQMLSRQIFAAPRSPSSAESFVAASDAYQLDLSEQALAYLDGSRPLSAVGSSPLNGLNGTGETFAEKMSVCRRNCSVFYCHAISTSAAR